MFVWEIECVCVTGGGGGGGICVYLIEREREREKQHFILSLSIDMQSLPHNESSQDGTDRSSVSSSFLPVQVAISITRF